MGKFRINLDNMIKKYKIYVFENLISLKTITNMHKHPLSHADMYSNISNINQIHINII